MKHSRVTIHSIVEHSVQFASLRRSTRIVEYSEVTFWKHTEVVECSRVNYITIQTSTVLVYTLTVVSASQRTSLKFLPRLELLLWKHTLIIFTGKMLSLATVAVGDTSEASDWLVEHMLLQDSVLVSPDITHSQHTHTHKHTVCTLLHRGTHRCRTFTRHCRVCLVSLIHTQTCKAHSRMDTSVLDTGKNWNRL